MKKKNYPVLENIVLAAIFSRSDTDIHRRFCRNPRVALVRKTDSHHYGFCFRFVFYCRILRQTIPGSGAWRYP